MSPKLCPLTDDASKKASVSLLSLRLQGPPNVFGEWTQGGART